MSSSVRATLPGRLLPWAVGRRRGSVRSARRWGPVMSCATTWCSYRTCRHVPPWRVRTVFLGRFRATWLSVGCPRCCRVISSSPCCCSESSWWAVPVRVACCCGPWEGPARSPYPCWWVLRPVELLSCGTRSSQNACFWDSGPFCSATRACLGWWLLWLPRPAGVRSRAWPGWCAPWYPRPWAVFRLR